MKRFRFILVLLITIAVVFISCGCNATKIKNDVEYREYVYDDETKDFVPTDYALTFSNNFGRYTMSFGDFAIIGTTTKYLSGYTLNVSPDVLSAISGLDDLILTDPDKYSDLLDTLKSTTVNQQVYFSNKYIFAHSSIAMIKDSASTGDLSSLDGVYEYSADSGIKFSLKDGFVYKITVKTADGKTTETTEEKPSLRYVIQEGIVKMIRIDENGKDVYSENILQSTSYLYATITYPGDFSEQYKNSSTTEYEKAKLLDGKTLAVLTNAFYRA